jgi:hypothetical protein
LCSIDKATFELDSGLVRMVKYFFAVEENGKFKEGKNCLPLIILK